VVNAAFTSNPESARAARRFVASTLDALGCPELIEVACLLTSELVTNAIVHAQGRIGLSVEVDDAHHLRVEVHDGAAACRAAPRQAAPGDQRGRGLAMVASLSDEWGVRPEPMGKTIWFALGS
jgi:anti-sigma regulatory factor (Ser/Thr protein kinase)